MDGNDTLSEENKIPLGHNRTNGAVYSKINFKLYNVTTVFITPVTTTTLLIVTSYCAQ